MRRSNVWSPERPLPREVLLPHMPAFAGAATRLLPDDFVVLQPGRLVERKGIDNVIHALACLPREVPARLVIVGGDSDPPDVGATPEIGRLRQLAAQLGVGERVRFAGRQRCQALLYDPGGETLWRDGPCRQPLLRATHWDEVRQAILAGGVRGSAAGPRARARVR